MLRRGRTNANGASREPSHKDLRGLWATVPVAQEVEDGLGRGEILLGAVSGTAESDESDRGEG